MTWKLLFQNMNKKQTTMTREFYEAVQTLFFKVTSCICPIRLNYFYVNVSKISQLQIILFSLYASYKGVLFLY